MLESIHVEVTSDFGQVEQAIQDEIDRNRAKVRVAADLSSQGVAEVRHEETVEKIVAEQALRDFETSQEAASSEDRRAIVVEQVK